MGFGGVGFPTIRGTLLQVLIIRVIGVWVYAIICPNLSRIEAFPANAQMHAQQMHAQLQQQSLGLGFRGV